jgi:hypothetical protein
MPVTATMLLCDSAQETNGKLYVLGGGWNTNATPNQPISMAVAILLDIPLEETTQPHEVEVRLTSDGEQVRTPADAPVLNRLRFGPAPPGALIGEGIRTDVPLAFAWHGLLLSPALYQWELRVDDSLVETAPFRVVDPPLIGGAA